jgi:malate/lactate dehydrogenase
LHQPAEAVISDQNWLEHDFVSNVQKRGAQVIAARGKSSAASAANAIIDTCKSLYFPTKKEAFYSVAKLSNGNPYHIKEDLIFSFPCRTLEDGRIEVVEGLKINSFLKEKIRLTENELVEEKKLILDLL